VYKTWLWGRMVILGSMAVPQMSGLSLSQKGLWDKGDKSINSGSMWRLKDSSSYISLISLISLEAKSARPLAGRVYSWPCWNHDAILSLWKQLFSSLHLSLPKALPSASEKNAEGSLRVVDSRTGKAYTIPIVRNSIAATDLRQISTLGFGAGLLERYESGLKVLDLGFENTAVCESRITYMWVTNRCSISKVAQSWRMLINSI
jgi:hypothetical protein